MLRFCSRFGYPFVWLRINLSPSVQTFYDPLLSWQSSDAPAVWILSFAGNCVLTYREILRDSSILPSKQVWKIVSIRFLLRTLFYIIFSSNHYGFFKGWFIGNPTSYFLIIICTLFLYAAYICFLNDEAKDFSKTIIYTIYTDIYFSKATRCHLPEIRYYFAYLFQELV